MAKRKKSNQRIIVGRIKGGELVDLKSNARDLVIVCLGGKSGVVKLLNKVIDQALKGSFKHQELLLNYILGKPVERLKLDASLDKENHVPIIPVMQIVASAPRLNKLAQDSEVIDEAMSEERIKQMEDLLNNHSEA